METPGKGGKNRRFWKAIVEWAGGMVGIIIASFLYSKVNPSYHNPFFNEPTGMLILLGIPTIWYWCWGRGKRYIRDK